MLLNLSLTHLCLIKTNLKKQRRTTPFRPILGVLQLNSPSWGDFSSDSRNNPKHQTAVKPMNFFRHIIPLSFVVLLIMNIYAFSLKTSIPSLLEIEDQSAPNGGDLTSVSSNPVYRPKVGAEITSGKTTLTTDKESYAPGEWATITAESTTDEMNGSLEWRLESPIGEVAFDFYSDFQDIFEDRFFNDPAIPDWTNESFYSIEATSGYLNLTEVADEDKDDVEVFYNTSLLNPDEYVISFDYFSQGQNLLSNPGFESGDFNDWNYSDSYVTRVGDPKNASEGTYYLDINGTEDYLLKQNVSIAGGNIKRKFIFSAKATGVTNDNYWNLKIEAYNSTGDFLEDTTSADSRDAIPDEKGYVTITLNWEIPENTTMLHFMFRGLDSGDDDRYTGWVDDCYLYEVPPELIFSYWGENDKWKEEPLTAGTHEWENSTYQVDMKQNLSKTFRFILPDDNSFSNNATSYWLIDNITVNLVTDSVPDIEIEPIINNLYSKSGNINSTWFHQGFRETLSSTFDVKVEAPKNFTVPSECQATIRVQLPIHQVYFGSWIFVYQIHRIKPSIWDPLDTKTINISFIVKEPMNYVVQDIYMLRGSENVTENNESVIISYFEQETNIHALSPGDNVTLLGFLEANSTRGEWYDLEYLKEGDVSSVSVEYVWNSNWQSRQNLTWEELGFIPYDKEGETLLDGNFDSPYDNTSTLAINFRVSPPGEIRGIFGNLSANLTITIAGNNVKSGDVDDVGGEPLVLTIPLNLPPVKFKINITEKNLPATSYYLNDYLGGNITLEFQNYNDTLETTFPNRTISSKLSIPMTDLELTIFLDNLNQTPVEKDISQQFHYNYIGKTILWFDLVNARLLPGTYAFRIRWNAPYKIGFHNQEELNIPHFIKIKGSLVVIPAEPLPEIQQGGQKTINFSIHLDNETGKEIGGLDLLGIVTGNQTYGNLIIYEEDNVYKIDLDVDPNLEANDYTIEIFIIGRADIIGDVTYRVTDRPKPSEDTLNPIEAVISIGGLAIFILAGVGTIFMLYWANKNLK